MLGVLTLVSFRLNGMKLKEDEKKIMMNHLKMLNMLISKREVILGKKKEFMKDEVSVNEVLEFFVLVHEKQLKKEHRKIILPENKLVVMNDSKVVKGGLEQILLNVMNLGKKIQIKADQKARKLTIEYDSKETLTISRDAPMKLLREKRDYSEIFLHMAVYLMKMTGIKVEFKKGLVNLTFPK